MGDKLGALFQNSSTVLGSVGIALGQGWKLTLVLSASLPFLAGIVLATRGAQARLVGRVDVALRVAGAHCEQALGAMRTIVSLSGEQLEVCLPPIPPRIPRS